MAYHPLVGKGWSRHWAGAVLRLSSLLSEPEAVICFVRSDGCESCGWAGRGDGDRCVGLCLDCVVVCSVLCRLGPVLSCCVRCVVRLYNNNARKGLSLRASEGGGFLLSHHYSTIGATGLNFSVRYG